MRSVALAGTLFVVLLVATPAGAATSVKRYTPWDGDGDPSVARYFHGSAECLRASRYNDRRDAWRCVSGNIRLDPCFKSPTDDEVFCVTSPWARFGYLLTAVIDEDDHGNSPAVGPWALQVGRRRCTFIRPPTRRRASYRCGNGRRGPFLFGRPNTKPANWTIRVARHRRGRGARRVRIRAAWL